MKKIDGIPTMVTMSEHDTRILVKMNSEEIEEFKKINETWNRIRGFWCSIGEDGVMGEEYDAYGYAFSDLTLDTYMDGKMIVDSVDYNFIDSDTVMLDFGDGDNKGFKVSFEIVDGRETMNLYLLNEVVHFERSTLDEYMTIMSYNDDESTLDKMQGFWYFAGIGDQLPDYFYEYGQGCRFEDSSYYYYDDFEFTDYIVSFKFIDENTMEYVNDSGESVKLNIEFEEIEGQEVMTLTMDGLMGTHYIKIPYDEWIANKPTDEE